MPKQATNNSNATWSLIDLSEDSNLDRIAAESPILIGRRPETDLCLECNSVSGEHARLSEKSGQLWIEDLQSTNGTFVNGIRIEEPSKLESGDIVQFGSIAFQVDTNEAKRPVGRTEMQTVQSEIPESPQGRFHRLLRVGAVPYFQPIFDISGKSATLVGYEVLGRGRLPGLCTPEEMFRAATEMDKTAELSESLRKNGIEVADANFSSGKLLFVNTHLSEISSDRLAESLARIRTCFPDRNFILELPEEILESPESLSIVEAATKDMNIDTAIYGFHAETIRLNALERLSPKVVKFSESLIRGIDQLSPRKQKVISSMVKMLIELGIQPMAEMVETPQEHETVKQLGFELAQGFHYDQPSSLEDCLEAQQIDVTENKDSTDSNEAKFTELKSDESPQKPTVTDSGIDWVLSQPEKNYTIQVMVTTSKTNASAFVAEQNAAEAFAIYPKMGKRRNLFVVVYGSFSNRDSARAAVEKFNDPTSVPLIRMFENVQAEARKAIF